MEVLPLQIFERNVLFVRLSIDYAPTDELRQILFVLGSHNTPNMHTYQQSRGRTPSKFIASAVTRRKLPTPR